MRYLFLLLLLTSCAHGDELAMVLSQPLDTTVQHQVAGQLSARRLKFKGPVTIQFGGANNSANATDAGQAHGPVATGMSQAQDNTKAGQHGGAVATAPGATAGATTRTGIPPWALVVGAVVLLLLLLGALVYRYRKRLLALA